MESLWTLIAVVGVILALFAVLATGFILLHAVVRCISNAWHGGKDGQTESRQL